MATPYPLVLASASPRRREILEALGVPYVVRASDVAEAPLGGEPAVATAKRLAVEKAAQVAANARERLVVGADTVVVHQGTILGKPADDAEAAAMLRRLRGRRHDVVSGVAVIDRHSGRTLVEALATAVWMREYGDDEVARYIARGEPFDKAGAYAIQDPHFRPVDRIDGCYLNVVGLPLCLLLSLLWQAGVPVPPPAPDRVRPLCPSCVLLPDG